MRTSVLAISVWLASSGLGAPQDAQTPAPAPAVPVATAPAVAQSPRTGSKIWIDRHAEVQEFLRSARIDQLTPISTGVTRPEKALFAPGGLALGAVVKHLPPGLHSGFWDSYKSEIAAYELDRLLGLDMVPVTVERRVGSDLASVQLWVENCRQLKGVDQSTCPRPEEWAKQVCRQRVFDDLIGNIDRNAGNLLIDPEWNLILIDHSRAFAADRMPFEKQTTRIDRALYERLKALDSEALEKHVRPWLLSGGNVRDILKRRDKIVARFDALAKEKGEAVVFPW
jgi:hypothetical protein